MTHQKTNQQQPQALVLECYMYNNFTFTIVLQGILGDGGRAAIQTQGSVSNPFGPTFVYGYRNIALEVELISCFIISQENSLAYLLNQRLSISAGDEEWTHCNCDVVPEQYVVYTTSLVQLIDSICVQPGILIKLLSRNKKNNQTSLSFVTDNLSTNKNCA